MFSISSHTARVAVTAGLVSALTLGGGSITALAEVAKADAPAAAAPAASADQTPAATPVENKAAAPVGKVDDVNNAVASVTPAKGGNPTYYDSLANALANATGSNTVAKDGDKVTLLKESYEKVEVSKRIVVTAANKNVAFKGTMTVTEGALIQGIHFVIDDGAAEKGIHSSVTVDGSKTVTKPGTVPWAAFLGDNIFEINVNGDTLLDDDYSSVTIDGAHRTIVGYEGVEDGINVQHPNEFILSTHNGNGRWYGININGDTKTVDSTSVSLNTVKIGDNGQSGPGVSVFFMNIEGGQKSTYGVTNITVTKNKVTGPRGANGLQVEGVNGLMLTDNTFAELYSVVMPLLKTDQFQKSDNIILGGNDMGGTLYDCFITSTEDYAKYLGDNGIIRKGEETKYPKATFLVAGLQNRSAKFSTYVGGALKEQDIDGTRLFLSVDNAVAQAKDDTDETVMLYGTASENVAIPAKKHVTIKLNGETILGKDGKSSTIAVENGGKLTIDGNGSVQRQLEGLFPVEVKEGGELTIKGGYYTGAIKSDYKNNDKLKIEAGYFSEEPNAAWVADGKGFTQVERNDGSKWWTVTDAKLETISTEEDIDVETKKLDNDDAVTAFKKELITKAAKVNVNGYTVVPTNEADLDAIVQAVKDQKVNTSLKVEYKATKNSTGSAIKDDKGAEVTVTVTYDLTSTTLANLEKANGDAKDALNNKDNIDKPDKLRDELTEAQKNAETVLGTKPTTQEAVKGALDKLNEALKNFNDAADEKASLDGLKQAITDADKALTDHSNKTDAAKDTLKKAIEDARKVVDSDPKKSEQQKVNEATEVLKKAIEDYINSANKPAPGGNGGGGTVTPTPKTYTVTFVDNVSYTTDQTAKVTSGQKVTKPADPTLKGYEFKGWFTDAGLKKPYDFSKPVTGDLTLFAKWAYPVTAPKTFADVDQNAWYVPGINFVTSHGLMHGYGDGTYFGVGKQLTRGELASILMNFAAPGYGPEDFRDAKNETDLPDIADGQFYTAAANWAVKNGVINGYADAEGNRTGFGPNDPVTMEQLVAILANLADKEGPDKADTAVLAKFQDPASVSPWATKSVAWAVEKGLIHGSGENGGLYLHGSANIMRERVATIFMNAFDEGILSFE